MGIDQRQKIERSLGDLITAIEEGATDARADFAADAPAGNAWVQVTLEHINFSYPGDERPERLLETLSTPPLPSMTCVAWEPRVYATLLVDDLLDVQWLSAFIDALFTTLHGAGPAYAVESTIEQ